VNIVVLLKQVPATDNVRMDPQTGTMIRTGKDNIINPLDENALAEAVRIKESRPGVRVTAVTGSIPGRSRFERLAHPGGEDLQPEVDPGRHRTQIRRCGPGRR